MEPNDFEPVEQALNELWPVVNKLRAALVTFCETRNIVNIHKLQHDMSVGEMIKLATHIQKVRR